MITPEVRGILKSGSTVVPKPKTLAKGESSEVSKVNCWRMFFCLLTLTFDQKVATLKRSCMHQSLTFKMFILTSFLLILTLFLTPLRPFNLKAIIEPAGSDPE